MPPNQEHSVWISKEEYDRLRQNELHNSGVVVSSSQPGQVIDEPAKLNSLQATVGITIAIGLFISLTNYTFRYASIPLIIILLIFAVMSLYDFSKAKHNADDPNYSAANNLASTEKNKKSRKYKLLMGLIFFMLFSPIIYGGIMLIFFIVILIGNGGHAAS